MAARTPRATLAGSRSSSSRDIPQLVHAYLAGDLLLDELVSRRRPLEEPAASLDDLAEGASLRQLLIP